MFGRQTCTHLMSIALVTQHKLTRQLVLHALLQGPLMTGYKAMREFFAAALTANPDADNQLVRAMCDQVAQGVQVWAALLRLDDDTELRKYLETDADYVRERHIVIQNMIKTGAYVPARDDLQLAQDLLVARGVLPAAPAAPAAAAIAAPPPAIAEAGAAPEDDAAA